MLVDSTKCSSPVFANVVPLLNDGGGREARARLLESILVLGWRECAERYHD